MVLAYCDEPLSYIWKSRDLIGKVCECVCGICVFAEDRNIFGTILIGGPLWTQFDYVVVLAVVFFALLSRSIGFQIFGN